MSKEPESMRMPLQEGRVSSKESGFQTPLQKGFVPSATPDFKGGHVPATGSGGPSGPPPNTGSAVRPPPKK